MPATGKHRRTKIRRISRAFAIASTGGAALTLPLTAAGYASAAPAAPASVSAIAVEKPVAAALPALPTAPTNVSATYTVIAGDTLSGIAKKQEVSGGWKVIYAKNKKAIGDDPSLIHPGLKLTIPGEREDSERASRTAERTSLTTTAAAATAAKSYPNNLDGWIRESLDIMAKRGIPGSYEGIHRNIMRESSGNPLAINNWDSNAAAGTPSKGLLQVIDPTFRAYHVPGTSLDPYDPVANITAACNYAAARYGSIDNVFGPY
ncbi:LysM peptidoglycan-binding domain-containing protein [Streptomyces sp. MUM 203J]|uniref:LysM peptidoglycan-binding domain-containing protein n=1 Tax=Streptomyces sp. MUM 203J TaxID=2791990 RepID=UPI001F0398FF|nr:LysM peptidoglycan-binding domain-containing protein [Streptomyces sp. MUM 203J]MCH0543092.1 LysM peptidoglycan-binding domain-containing protein [Streptomyces sp. MUM 203J]